MTTHDATVTAVHVPGTDLAPYSAAPVEQYQAALAMTPEQAKALDEQVRACTRAVLREGTDFGVIPGTGTGKVLLKPGAEKLLQWFGFGFDCVRLEVDVDDEGRKQGVTYRCTVTKRIGDPRAGLKVDVSTCEGYAGYDESKFYQPAEEAQRKAEANERFWAKKDRRVANPTKWQNIGEYRAPWNTLLKMAQKRAIVGATIFATAAGGLFSQEEDGAPVADDGSTWYEQAIEQALSFTAEADGSRLYVDAAHAARDGLCTSRQKDHIQNRIRQRQQLLTRAPVVDLDAGAVVVEDQGDTQPAATPEPTEKPSDQAPEREAAPRGSTPSVLGTVSRHLERLGYDPATDEGLRILSDITGHYITALADLTVTQAKAATALMAKCKTRDALEQLLANGAAPGQPEEATGE